LCWKFSTNRSRLLGRLISPALPLSQTCSSLIHGRWPVWPSRRVASAPGYLSPPCGAMS
jgi:hypothetical protein